MDQTIKSLCALEAACLSPRIKSQLKRPKSGSSAVLACLGLVPEQPAALIASSSRAPGTSTDIMATELDELIGFLTDSRAPIRKHALDIVLGLTGSAEGLSHLRSKAKLVVAALLRMVCSQDPKEATSTVSGTAALAMAPAPPSPHCPACSSHELQPRSRPGGGYAEKQLREPTNGLLVSAVPTQVSATVWKLLSRSRDAEKVYDCGLPFACSYEGGHMYLHSPFIGAGIGRIGAEDFGYLEGERQKQWLWVAQLDICLDLAAGKRTCAARRAMHKQGYRREVQPSNLYGHMLAGVGEVQRAKNPGMKA
eukprot:1159024-Pelagomonas_calceolata.AAC.6